MPAASLDADDPLDEENSDDPDSDDDTAQLLAELQRIKKERAMDQAKRVSRDGAAKILCHLHELEDNLFVLHWFISYTNVEV